MGVEQMAREIVRREGGFVNNPNDPGGATNFGVTIGTMKRLGLDLDGDKDVDIEDVRRLTQDQAVQIFIDHYFHKPKISSLPVILHETVFDMQVNAGGNAIKILQRLLVAFGVPVQVDGAIGPKTVAAAMKVAEIAPDHLVDAYGAARRNYYLDIADRRPKSRVFARNRKGGKGGWIVRAEEFMATRFHLTDEQWQERISQWA